jgi:phage tail sheath protein FI
MGALALNDAVGYPWFAPAGFTRGALPTVQEAAVKLSKDNMDQLYDAAINPLVAFPGSSTSGVNPKGGVVVWGQKTLQAAASALDRVNVRRLLIEIRRQVRDVARTFLFEPNRAATLARFSSAVSPKLQRIQQLAGLNDFRVIIDTTTTTQQDVENNTIRGKIFDQPTKTIEFVSLDFVVANNVAQSV